METLQKIPPTICRDCVFAIWEGHTQTDCKFDRINKLKKNGAAVTEVYDEAGKEFYVINDRVCNKCRNADWGKKHPRRKWPQAVSREIVTKCDVVVMMGEDDDVNDVITTVNSAYSQGVAPTSLIIVLSGDFAAPIVSAMVAKGVTPAPWLIESSPEPDENMMLGIAAKAAKGEYLIVTAAGLELPDDFIASIDKMLNEDMVQFIIMQCQEYAMVIHRLAYLQHGTPEKMATAMKEQNLEHLYREYRA
jgi:hypothetical protein